MDAKMQTLSTLSAALLLALAAGCAGPSQDAEFESVDPFPGPAEPEAAEPAPEPAQEAEPEPEPAEDEAELTYGAEYMLEQRRMDQEALEASRKNPSGYDHDFTVLAMGGSRMLDNSDWEPVDNLFTGGLNFMARGPGGWFHWDVAFFYGDDDGNVVDADLDQVSVSSRVYEIDAGVAKIFDIGIFRPYIGVGAAYVNAEAELYDGVNEQSISEDDGSFGGYGRAGIMLEVTDTGGLVGVEARYLVGTSIDIGGLETDVDGLQALFTLGFSW